MAARSSVSSAKNELFVQNEHRQFVRNPSLSPPLPYLASLPDTGDTLGFSPSQVCGASQSKPHRMDTHYYKIDRLRGLRSSSLFERSYVRVMCSLCVHEAACCRTHVRQCTPQRSMPAAALFVCGPSPQLLVRPLQCDRTMPPRVLVPQLARSFVLSPCAVRLCEWLVCRRWALLGPCLWALWRSCVAVH